MYGIIKTTKLYVLHDLSKNIINRGANGYYHQYKTKCGFEGEYNETFANFDLKRDYSCERFIAKLTKYKNGELVEILGPIELYKSTKLPQADYYDRVCPECFPNGVEAED